MSDTKKTLMDREYTRRQFMKLSGKGLAGVALSSTLLSLMGCTRSQAEAGLVDTIATPDFLLVANRAKCTGCQRCEVNCTLANDGDAHPYMARIRVRQNVNFGDQRPTIISTATVSSACGASSPTPASSAPTLPASTPAP